MSSPPAPSKTTATTTADSDCDARHNTQPGRFPTRNGQLVLPPLPQTTSSSARSSSPRHHAATSASTSASASASVSASAASASSSGRTSLRAGNFSAFSDSPSTPTRQQPQQRQRSPYYWPVIQRNTSGINLPPNLWGEDTINNAQSLPDTTSNSISLGSDDELFLESFADNDFSSPSGYPLFTPNLPAGEASQTDQAAFQPQHAAFTNPGSTAPPRRTSACTPGFAASVLSTTRPTSSSAGDSQNTSFTTDTGDESPSRDSFSDNMPPPPRRRHLDRVDSSSMTKKRRTTSQADNAQVDSAAMEPLAMPSLSDDDLFGDFTTGDHEAVDDDLPTIDLTETNEVPVEPTPPPQVDNRTKISKFQCVICMDDATTLTVTHCGHLYCAQCLHQSLHVEATRGKCPMCRAKIDIKPRNNYNSKTKGYWHLELKLMTASKGKRKADNIS